MIWFTTRHIMLYGTVGVFSCPITPVPARCLGFLRKLADFASQPVNRFLATIHSLPSIILSGITLGECLEVRKGRDFKHYKSISYTRTNQCGWIAALGTVRNRPESGRCECFMWDHLVSRKFYFYSQLFAGGDYHYISCE